MNDFLLPLQFRRADGTYLEIYVEAWVMMRQFVQHHAAGAEAGGVLLGRHLRDKSAIIVDTVTTPQPGDQRSRTRFRRARRRHQELIDQAWRDSAGTCTYLGEWHTHPEPIPVPSSTDVTDWRRRLRADQYTEPLFFLIVGKAEIGVWEGNRQELIVPLQVLRSK